MAQVNFRFPTLSVVAGKLGLTGLFRHSGDSGHERLSSLAEVAAWPKQVEPFFDVVSGHGIDIEWLKGPALRASAANIVRARSSVEHAFGLKILKLAKI